MNSDRRPSAPLCTTLVRWAIWTVPASVVGLLHVVLAIDPLVVAYGNFVGATMATLSGIGLGLLVAVFTKLFVRLGKSSGQRNDTGKPFVSLP